MRCFALLFVSLALPLAAAPPRFTLADGDRIVFVGSTLVERDGQFGYFETQLNLHIPDARFTFRNLGWSGDTVWGEARASFGTPKDGYKKLVQDVTNAKPTVLLLNYGMNESFEGAAGLPRFIEQFNALLDDLSKTGAKVWLIGPNRHEDLGRPLPDPTRHNEQLKQYIAAIAQLAARRGCGFVDLFQWLPAEQRLTDDGIHFSE